jgi:hypothetical protein
MSTYRLKESLIIYDEKSQYASGTEIAKAKTPFHFNYNFCKKNNAEKKPKIDVLKVIKPPSKFEIEMMIGRAVHTLVLEPDIFKNHFAYFDRSKLPFPTESLRNPKNKEYYNNFRKQNFEKQILEYDSYLKVVAMRDSIYQNVVAIKQLFDGGYIENIWYSDKNEYNIKNKVRIDFVKKDKPYILDVTTTTNAHPTKLANEFIDNNKHISFGNQLWSVNNDPDRKVDEYKRIIIIAVEKYPPYAVSCFNLDDNFIEFSKHAFNKRMETLKKCFETKKWPSYDILAGQDNKTGISEAGVSNFKMNYESIW